MVINKVNMAMPQLPSFDNSQKTTAPEKAFGEVLQQALQSTVNAQEVAENMSAAAAQGENIPMHKVVEAVTAAEIKLQTLVTVRDRAVSAYQQLTQMPI